MLANFLNTRQTFVCQHCWQTHVGQHLFVVCPRLNRFHRPRLQIDEYYTAHWCSPITTHHLSPLFYAKTVLLRFHYSLLQQMLHSVNFSVWLMWIAFYHKNRLKIQNNIIQQLFWAVESRMVICSNQFSSRRLFNNGYTAANMSHDVWLTAIHKSLKWRCQSFLTQATLGMHDDIQQNIQKHTHQTYLSFEDLNKRVNDTQLPSIWHPDLTVGVMPDRQEKYNEHVSQWSRSPLST